MFTSTFSERVKIRDLRTRAELGGGTLYDISIYCINAARYLFRAEPIEVLACSVNATRQRLPNVDESTPAILKFDGGRVALFVSFNPADVGAYEIVGTKGHLRVDPAYETRKDWRTNLQSAITPLRGKHASATNLRPSSFTFQTAFSQEPEPSGEEGLQDVRIIRALYESAETHKPVEIPPYQPLKRPTRRQRIDRPAVEMPALVATRSPTE